MDVGDWIAVGSVIVAAERSASAEERAANATEAADAAQRAPRLSFRPKGVAGQETLVEVVLVGGPPELDIRATGIWNKDQPGPGLKTTLAVESGTSRISDTGVHIVPIDLRARREELTIEITVECI